MASSFDILMVLCMVFGSTCALKSCNPIQKEETAKYNANGIDIATDSKTNERTFDFKSVERTIFDFEISTWKTDFVLNVEGKKLYVSKIILALASPVFENIFSNQSIAEMSLPGKRVHDVIDFLHCIYPQSHLPMAENAEGILVLADEFSVDYLKLICEKALVESIDNTTDANRLMELLNVAHEYSLGILSETCVNLLARKPLIEITKAEKKRSVSPEAMVIVLEKINEQLLHTAEAYANYIELSCWKSRRQRLDINDLVGRSLHFNLTNTAGTVVKQNVSFLKNLSLSITIAVSEVDIHRLYLFKSSMTSIYVKINNTNGDRNFKMFARAELEHEYAEKEDVIVNVYDIDEEVEIANSDRQPWLLYVNYFNIWVHILNFQSN